MANVTMYCTRICPYCLRAEEFLRRKGVTVINKIQIDSEPNAMSEMMTRTGRRTVPQIYIDEVHVGGYDDLVQLDRDGGVDPLLAAGVS